MVTYVIIIIIIALLLDLSNGLNDTANSITTAVATGVLSLRPAVPGAAFVMLGLSPSFTERSHQGPHEGAICR